MTPGGCSGGALSSSGGWGDRGTTQPQLPHCTRGGVPCLLHKHTSHGRCGCVRLLGRRNLRGMAPGGCSGEALRSFGGWGCCVRAPGCVPICVVVCILQWGKIHLASASGCGLRSACAAEGACCGCRRGCEVGWVRLRRPAAVCGRLPVCSRLQQPVGWCRLQRLCAACARAVAWDLALSTRDRLGFRAACAAVDALTRGTSNGSAPAATRHADRSE